MPETQRGKTGLGGSLEYTGHCWGRQGAGPFTAQSPVGWAFPRQACLFSHLIYRACNPYSKLVLQVPFPAPHSPINIQKNNSRERGEDERMFTERPLWE